MEKVLNQEEIDAMVRAARGGRQSTEKKPKVAPCSFRQAGQLGREQVRAITMLHENCARNLTHSLGAYLRVPFEANLVSVEQLSYREFLARVPEVAYLASFELKPLNIVAALQMDQALTLPIVDLLLGGEGKPQKFVREVTEIEEEIVEVVVRIMCRELQTGWYPLGLEFLFQQRQKPAQMQRLMPPTEKTLSLSFEITMPEVHGMLNLVFPAVVSNSLLRKLSKDWAYQKPRASAEAGAQIRERLLDCDFPLELALPNLPAAMQQLLALKPGDVVNFEKSVNETASLLISGRAAFHARVVNNGTRLAAQIHGSCEMKDAAKELAS
jgi:flagellar motor switch protein FliM